MLPICDPNPDPNFGKVAFPSARMKKTKDLLYRVHNIFKDIYEIGEILGQGAYGVVWKATSVKTGDKFAIKCSWKKDVPYTYIMRDRQRGLVPQEVFVLSRLQHPNIIRFVDYCHDEECFFLITESRERCVDLYEFIERNPYLPEERLCKIAKQIFLAVSYLHEMGFVHRDIKDENVLIDENDNVFLLDFGYSRHIPQNQLDFFTDIVGTYHCMSPELLRREPYSGIPQDVWALGVLLFTLTFRVEPFNDEVLSQLANGTKGHLCFTTNGRSKLLCDLLKRFLDLSHTSRISMKDVLDHPWVTGVPEGIGQTD